MQKVHASVVFLVLCAAASSILPSVVALRTQAPLSIPSSLATGAPLDGPAPIRDITVGTPLGSGGGISGVADPVAHSASAGPSTPAAPTGATQAGPRLSSTAIGAIASAGRSARGFAAVAPAAAASGLEAARPGEMLCWGSDGLHCFDGVATSVVTAAVIESQPMSAGCGCSPFAYTLPASCVTDSSGSFYDICAVTHEAYDPGAGNIAPSAPSGAAKTLVVIAHPHEARRDAETRDCANCFAYEPAVYVWS
ncbi:MAG: hypothetical protein ACYDDF_01565 [Thermoplasmatota archaeon]